MFNLGEVKPCDMATADIDRLYAGILVRKRIFFPKPRKKFKIKPIVKNGRIKHIEIKAPYGYIVQLFKMLNYKPIVDEEFYTQNHFGNETGYVYREEWENSCIFDTKNNFKGAI